MATYYVGIGGSDANNGTTWALRKLTLNGAEDIPVAAGDTVYVGPGTYRESLTVDVSGSAGNIITYIGDYTGANTTGSSGVVRVTGSADDIALTRAACITAASKNYRTFRGLVLDMGSSYIISGTACTYWTIDKCHISGKSGGINIDEDCTNVSVTNCFIWSAHYSATGIIVGTGNSTKDNRAIAVDNCVFVSGYGSRIYYAGGVTFRNCAFLAGLAGVQSQGLASGQVTTVNNCIVAYNSTGLYSDATAKFAENYNTLFGNATARTNVTAGANSVARPPLFDPRWFFEAVNGGTMVTPWDLASYSTLVEYNSGTGAPSTDIRGASAVGTYREWGPLEYDSTYDIAAGAGAAGGLITHPGMGGGIRG